MTIILKITTLAGNQPVKFLLWLPHSSPTWKVWATVLFQNAGSSWHFTSCEWWSLHCWPASEPYAAKSHVRVGFLVLLQIAAVLEQTHWKLTLRQKFVRRKPTEKLSCSLEWHQSGSDQQRKSLDCDPIEPGGWQIMQWVWTGIWSKGVRTLWPPTEQSLDVGYSQGGHLSLGKAVLFITQSLERSIPHSQVRKQVPWSWKGHLGSTVLWPMHAVNSVPRLAMGSHLQQLTSPLWSSPSSAIK